MVATRARRSTGGQPEGRRRFAAVALSIALVSGACATSPSLTPAGSQAASGSASADATAAASLSPSPTASAVTSGAQAAIESRHLGSAWLTTQTTASVAALRSVSDAVQAEATLEATGGVRFFIAANQEGGRIQALHGPAFSVIPSAVVQGRLSPDALWAQAAQWGAELLAAGISFNFAPVADTVPAGTERKNAPIGALQREYGSNPARVGPEVAAFIAGMRAAGVATSAKHFPGLGRVVGNTDFTGGVVDTVTVRNDPYLEPFRAAVDAGVPFVMVSLATYTKLDPDHLAAFSPTIIDGILRGDLGFGGVVISDDLGAAKAVAGIAPADRALLFVRAGGDMIISATIDAAVEMADALDATSAADPALRERIDDAALRILRAKDAFGLLPCSA